MADPVVGGGRPLGSDLSRLGVRYVLLLKESDWKRFAPQVAGLKPVLETKELTLFGSAEQGRIPPFPQPPAGAVAVGDGAAAAIFAWGLLARRRPGRSSRVRN